MLNKDQTQTSSNSSWIPSLAILSIGFILLLIAGTIVLALIPLYLKSKNVTLSNQNYVVINALYASDLVDGHSRILSDADGVSEQINKNMFPKGTNLDTRSVQILPAVASNKKKRETSKSTITCEQATGLYGHILSAQHVLQYPSMCWKPFCQQRYLKTIEEQLRRKAQITIQIKFTNGEILSIKIAFCSFSIAVIGNPTLDTTISSSVTTTPISLPNASKYIYLLDQDNNFLRFHPVTSDVTFIGTINCSTTAYPYSMAMQSNGKAWTLFTDGNLYTFDIQTAQCQSTSYVPERDEALLFGMHFARDQSSNTEKLYISSESFDHPNHLATLDTNTLEISVIGYYRTLSARAELTATHDGKLFGLFEGEPYIIAEINQTTGEILSKTLQNAIEYQSDSSYFAFASYSSDFYLFVGNSSSTDIFLYDAATKITSKQTTISNGIIGAAILSNALHF